MSQLAAEIAVLDGLDDLYGSSMELDPSDGRIGQEPATGHEYTQRLMPGVYARNWMVDASAGANYSGGSTYAPGLPLMPSSVGLADAEFENYARTTNVLPALTNVIDPSGGANYTGGSSWTGGVPLTVSSSGLAELSDLAAASQMLDPSDGRIGQEPAYGTEYSRWVMPHVYARSNVVDASGGANYAGGSSYAPGLPLMPSSVGLAGLDAILDGLEDEDLGISPTATAVKKAVGKGRLRKLRARLKSLRAEVAKTGGTPEVRAKVQQMVNRLMRLRMARRGLFNKARMAAAMAMHR